jgi:single-strand DNA-binding protein
MATDEVFRDKGGEMQRRTEWHRIVAWSKLAEQCQRIMKKGNLAYVEGQLRSREWNDREGNKRNTTEIVAFRVRNLTPKGEPRPEQTELGPEPPEDTVTEITDEDVPF